ncbi:MAG: GTPase [Planctomycetota bacterium]
MTIAAVASAPGDAIRAVVRLAGDLEPIRPIIDAFPERRGVSPVRLTLGDHALPCLCIRGVAPNSYTGDDTLELLIPGGGAIVDRVMRTLLAQTGVRPAEPGEFTARAFLAGRLSLDEARGVEAIITAANGSQLAEASRWRSGDLGRRAADWADRAARLLALVEAGIDFADQEDVEAIAPIELVSRLNGLLAEIEDALGSSAGAEARAGTPRVVLLGPPSAGKSTLFNALLGRRRAVTAAASGTTADALAETLELAPGLMIELVDLPGLDDARSRGLAERELAQSDLAIACDPSGVFAAAPEAALRVRTKADRPGPDGAVDLDVCALTGVGLDDLRCAIADRLMGGRAETGLTRAIDAGLAGAAEALARAVAASEGRQPPMELAAGELRAALDALGGLTGRVEPDAVLGLIFSTFCVGK